MSIIVSESKKEKLGTYISQQDLSQILSSNNVSSKLTKSYFVNPEEDRINRIMEFVQEIANIMLEYLPENIIKQIIIQFQNLIPAFLNDFGDKYFTKKHIANYFLALLDYRLSLVGGKLSPKHIDEIVEVTGMTKGRTFSYFQVKQIQLELIAAGYIKKKRKIILLPLLKTKVTQICYDFIQEFPSLGEKFHKIREKSYQIIDMQKYPQIDVDEAALIIVTALFPYFFSMGEINQKFWPLVVQNYNMELKAFKQRIYRYRSILKKEGTFEELF